jgi:hypothetical protein
MFFLRLTKSPEADIARGFSGYEGTWFARYEDAVLHRSGNPDGFPPARQDPATGMWCADPEWGLSAYGFEGEAGFERALGRLSAYWDGAESVAVFASGDYLLRVGADGEDCFRPGTHLGWIAADGCWNDVVRLLPDPRNGPP